ncbi:hypothetical protein KJ877_01820 [bacterium]|nr:hypothetical protein [bacterium]MBU1990881.1 hypothetical protein [bacterium]
MPKLTNKGVNALNAQTPYLANSILPNLLGYDIDHFTAFESGKPVNIMRVRYNTQEAMIITPTKTEDFSSSYIKSITITSDLVQNPFNLSIGDTLDANAFSKCKTADEIVCKNKGFENIKIIFTKNKNGTYILKEFVWAEDDSKF